MLADDSMKEELAGTTAVIVLIKNSKIFCVSISELIISFLHWQCLNKKIFLSVLCVTLVM